MCIFFFFIIVQDATPANFLTIFLKSCMRTPANFGIKRGKIVYVCESKDLSWYYDSGTYLCVNKTDGSLLNIYKLLCFDTSCVNGWISMLLFNDEKTNQINQRKGGTTGVCLCVCVCSQMSVCMCVWEYVFWTVWSGRSALWDRCPHLVLNYSSCQLACPPSPWKPLTRSFTPIPTDSPLHPLLGPHFLLARSLIISSLIHSFTASLSPHSHFPVHLTSPIFSSVFPRLPLFSISVFLISPELPLTSLSFLLSLSLSPCISPCWHSLLCCLHVAD